MINMFQDYTLDYWETFIARAMWNRRTCWREPCCYLDPNLLGWCLANRRHTNLNRKHVLVLAFKHQLKYINLTGSIIGSAAINPIRAFSEGRFSMAHDCIISGQRTQYPWARGWGSPPYWKSSCCARAPPIRFLATGRVTLSLGLWSFKAFANNHLTADLQPSRILSACMFLESMHS